MEEGKRNHSEDEREEREREQAKKARFEEVAKGKKPVDELTEVMPSSPSDSDSFASDNDFTEYMEQAARPPTSPRPPNAPPLEWPFKHAYRAKPWLFMHLFPSPPPWAYELPPWELHNIKCDVSNFAETVQHQTGYSPSSSSDPSSFPTSFHHRSYTAEFLREVTSLLPTFQNRHPRYNEIVFNEIARSLQPPSQSRLQPLQAHDGNRMASSDGSSSSSAATTSQVGTSPGLSLASSNTNSNNTINQEQDGNRMPSSGGSSSAVTQVETDQSLPPTVPASSSSANPLTGNASTLSPSSLDPDKKDGDSSSFG